MRPTVSSHGPAHSVVLPSRRLRVDYCGSGWWSRIRTHRSIRGCGSARSWEPLVINERPPAATLRKRVLELLELVSLPSAPPSSSRMRSRAASASAPRSPGRSRCRRSWSCSTSPCARPRGGGAHEPRDRRHVPARSSSRVRPLTSPCVRSARTPRTVLGGVAARSRRAPRGAHPERGDPEPARSAAGLPLPQERPPRGRPPLPALDRVRAAPSR